MEHRDRIIQTEDGESFLPVSVIYGPNGGGKFNVLEALHTLNAKYDKQYLEGKYGADPYLKNIIDWSEVNA